MYTPPLICGLFEDGSDRHLQFSQNIWCEEREGDVFVNKMVWSDEANCTLCGTVNGHNCVHYDSGPQPFYRRGPFNV